MPFKMILDSPLVRMKISFATDVLYCISILNGITVAVHEREEAVMGQIRHQQRRATTTFIDFFAGLVAYNIDVLSAGHDAAAGGTVGTLDTAVCRVVV